jgi:two-component system, chemotaxis family, response regulator PixG
MTSPSSTFLNKLAQQLNALSQKKVTGILVLSNTNPVAQLHIMGGRLLYVTGGDHPIRRWIRMSNQYCPKLSKDTSILKDSNLWETQLLVQGLMKKEISLKDAKLTLLGIAQEFFFELASYSELKMQWKAGNPPTSKLTLQMALSFEEMKPALVMGLQLYQQWQQGGLTKLNPNLAPFVAQKIPPNAIGGLGQYLNGEFSLWDLAQKSKKSIVLITKSLVPLVQKKVLQFKKLSDLPIPISGLKTVTNVTAKTEVKTSQKTYLIACIDDSPAVGNTMQRILQPKGYKVLTIEDPLKGMTQLLKDKPDLIFLDVIMPTANGYSVCQSLRKMALFKATPVIILSARDTPKDREMAQKVGANDFLSKPPKTEEILAMVQKHLK